MPINRLHVTKPEDVPHKEHWAIITGSSVSHEEHGVWAPGHGYPAYTEEVVEYTAYFNEQEFLAELQKEFSNKYNKKCIGIHVDKLYTSKTVVNVLETPLVKRCIP